MQKSFLVFLIFLVLGIGIFILGLNLKIAKKKEAAEKELNFLKTNLQQLEIQKQEYLKKNSDVKNQDFLEKIGRENFNLQKEGEKVISLPELKEVQKSKKKSEDNKNFFKEFLKKLGF